MDTVSTPEIGQRLRGRVELFWREPGWGFISTPQLPDAKIFFHYTSLEGPADSLRNIDPLVPVEFTLTEGKKGLAAIDIKRLPTRRDRCQDLTT